MVQSTLGPGFTPVFVSSLLSCPRDKKKSYL